LIELKIACLAAATSGLADELLFVGVEVFVLLFELLLLGLLH